MLNLKEKFMSTDPLLLKYPPLTAVTSQWMTDLLDNHQLLDNLFKEYGSPINIHNAGPFEKNYELFKQVLEKHGLDHTIFFARKANKCRIFVKEAIRLGFGVDSASYQELIGCLDLGCDPNKLVLTAAVKNEQLVRLALQQGVLMILDNIDECELADKLAGELGLTPKVGIRVSGFYDKEKKLYSRFGFDIDHIAEFITSHFGCGNRFENLRFDGFHFHLNGYSMVQRSEALLQTINLADRLLTHGFQTSFIDMGGGILINYLSDKFEWEEFWSELKKAVREERPPVTFGNRGLGFELIINELYGEPDVYPYYNEINKENFLDKVLTYKNQKGETPATRLRERGIELRMEPGRSLLDQTGITIAKVIHRKNDMRGNRLIGLGMNRNQLASSSADFLVDPLYISVHNDSKEKKATPLFFTGGYCLEQDLILKRKIVLPQLPEVGDIICFPNTAGYMMHFYETQSHLFDLATNLVINQDSDEIKIQHDEL